MKAVQMFYFVLAAGLIYGSGNVRGQGLEPICLEDYEREVSLLGGEYDTAAPIRFGSGNHASSVCQYPVGILASGYADGPVFDSADYLSPCTPLGRSDVYQSVRATDYAWRLAGGDGREFPSGPHSVVWDGYQSPPLVSTDWSARCGSNGICRLVPSFRRNRQEFHARTPSAENYGQRYRFPILRRVLRCPR